MGNFPGSSVDTVAAVVGNLYTVEHYQTAELSAVVVGRQYLSVVGILKTGRKPSAGFAMAAVVVGIEM